MNQENLNCKCGLIYQDTDNPKDTNHSFDGFYNEYLARDVGSLKETINRLFGINTYQPKRILKNGIATIVFWEDGTKTVVKCAPGETPDDYDAFTAALAIKVFGSNSALKKVIKAKTEIQKGKE